jgi:archaemetzincin
MDVYLAPLKFSNTPLLDKIRNELTKCLPLEIKKGELKIDIENSYSKERAQYFSTSIISEAIKLSDALNGKVVILTEADLFIPVLTFVFGEAQLNGKHSIVSVCRLHEEFYTGKTDEDLLLKRTMKEILHELGHNFGLKHCHDWDCVMHSSTSIEEVDIKGDNYCKACAGSVTM